MDSAGVEGNEGSSDSDISDDGLVVSFISLTSNLVPNDTNFCGSFLDGHCPDVFVHDLGQVPPPPRRRCGPFGYEVGLARSGARGHSLDLHYRGRQRWPIGSNRGDSNRYPAQERSGRLDHDGLGDLYASRPDRDVQPGNHRERRPRHRDHPGNSNRIRKDHQHRHGGRS